MPDLLRLLNIGRNAIFAQSAVMNTRGQNIANVNTEGYSRQRVNLAPGISTVTAQGIFGTGVEVKGIERIRNQFIDLQLIQERSSSGMYEFKSGALEYVEQVFNEPSDFGLNKMFEDFWNAWHDLANNPESQGARHVVKEAGATLAGGFNRLHRQLNEYVRGLNKELKFQVDEINRFAKKVASLNKKIVNFEVNGEQASDLRDERDLIIDKLSKLVNIQTVEQKTGAMNVSLGGRSLVIDTTAEELGLATTSTTDNGPGVVWAADNQVANISQGTVKGLLDIRDSNVPNYLNQLDELARSLTQEVNALHFTGYNLAGDTHNYFFNNDTTGAADISLSTAIQNDAGLIATAAGSGTPGDNSIALAIANLQESSKMNNGKTTYNEFYNSIIATLGAESHEALFLHKSFNLTVEKLENYRDSISGVSLDEEMIGMIEAQQAFNAASKYITTIDEMTQTILSLT